MRKLPFAKSVLSILLISLIFISCKKNKDNPDLTPSQILSSKTWQTTGAKNETGTSIALTDPSVAGFVGFAYFKTDGNFTIFALDDTPRSSGTWSISSDGKTRTLTTPTFTRVVDILVLNADEFTYRIFPDQNNRTKFFDIKHTPVNHAEPKFLTPSEILASTGWITSDAINEKGEKIPLTSPAVVGFVGLSYFNINGNFSIYNLDKNPRISGTWTVSADGRTRTLVFNNITRIVNVTALTKSVFTYRHYPTDGVTSVYYDIIHTPTQEKQP